MKLKDLYHVGIPVDDIDRARDFYTKVLGMQFLSKILAMGPPPDNADLPVLNEKFKALRRTKIKLDGFRAFINNPYQFPGYIPRLI